MEFLPNGDNGRHVVNRVARSEVSHAAGRALNTTEKGRPALEIPGKHNFVPGANVLQVIHEIQNVVRDKNKI